MGTDRRTMVIPGNIYLAALTLASVVIVIPSRADACGQSDLLGRVKAIIATEALVDLMTGRIGEARQVLSIFAAQDGGIVETTLYGSGRRPEPRSKLTAYFQGGKLARQFEVVDGKTISTTTCSYDEQGRIVETRTQSENAEHNIVETYEYGSALIRRRVKTFGGPSVVTQTLDATGRVVKEVEFNEAMSKVVQTIDFTYTDGREERCGVSFIDPRRKCKTIVRDSHGNEVETRAEGQTVRTSFEYDSVGNWVSKRTVISGPRGTSVDIIVRRKIEYW